MFKHIGNDLKSRFSSESNSGAAGGSHGVGRHDLCVFSTSFEIYVSKSPHLFLNVIMKKCWIMYLAPRLQGESSRLWIYAEISSAKSRNVHARFSVISWLPGQVIGSQANLHVWR